MELHVNVMVVIMIQELMFVSHVLILVKTVPHIQYVQHVSVLNLEL